MTSRRQPTARRSAAAFTIVEILVVTGIVAVLVAMLMPALTRARSQARIVACTANLKQVGAALEAYVLASDGSYPAHHNWGDLMGKRGTKQTYDRPGFVTGFAGDTGVTGVRPLNPFLRTAEILRCPDDIGDTFYADVPNCFDAYGTSYLVQWGSSVFRVARVTATGSSASQTPLRKSAVRNPSLKIVLGDWNWHPNRHLTQPRTVWHRMSSKERQMSMLFADGHAEYLRFPIGYSDLPSYTQPIDPGYGFY